MALDACIGVAAHFTLSLRHEHHDFGFHELRAQERRIAMLGARSGGDEAPFVEFVVQAHQKRTKAADGRKVCLRRRTHENFSRASCFVLHYRSTCAIPLSPYRGPATRSGASAASSPAISACVSDTFTA